MIYQLLGQCLMIEHVPLYLLDRLVKWINIATKRMYVQWMKPLDNISTLDELTILISSPPPPQLAVLVTMVHSLQISHMFGVFRECH